MKLSADDDRDHQRQLVADLGRRGRCSRRSGRRRRPSAPVALAPSGIDVVAQVRDEVLGRVGRGRGVGRHREHGGLAAVVDLAPARPSLTSVRLARSCSASLTSRGSLAVDFRNASCCAVCCCCFWSARPAPAAGGSPAGGASSGACCWVYCVACRACCSCLLLLLLELVQLLRVGLRRVLELDGDQERPVDARAEAAGERVVGLARLRVDFGSCAVVLLARADVEQRHRQQRRGSRSRSTAAGHGWRPTKRAQRAQPCGVLVASERRGRG